MYRVFFKMVFFQKELLNCNIKKQMLQQKIVNQIILDYNPIYAISEESLDVRIIDGV